MKKWLRTSLPCGLALWFGSALLGCGSGPAVVQVGGTVTRNGEPVPNVTVRFIPDQGRPSFGVSDAKGRYTLKFDKNRDGAVPGSHRVVVEFRPMNPKEEEARNRGEWTPHPEYQAIKEKYGSLENAQRVEVGTSNDQDIPIKLD